MRIFPAAATGSPRVLPTSKDTFLVGGEGSGGLSRFNATGGQLWSYPLNGTSAVSVSGDGNFAAASSVAGGVGMEGQSGSSEHSLLLQHLNGDGSRSESTNLVPKLRAPQTSSWKGGSFEFGHYVAERETLALSVKTTNPTPKPRFYLSTEICPKCKKSAWAPYLMEVTKKYGQVYRYKVFPAPGRKTEDTEEVYPQARGDVEENTPRFTDCFFVLGGPL